jgi:hypothetical protein
MQGYQDHISATSANYMAYLMTPRATFSTHASAWTKRVVDEDSPGVPDSPGCARRLRPYPPSHRRRQ